MTDRELMQQALEALDAYSWEQVQAATTALRERLAQPEQELVMKRIKTWSERCEEHPDHQQGMISEGMIRARMQEEIDELRQALETEQEPVAWGVFDGPNLHDTFFTEDEAQEMVRLKGDGSIVKPLYTTPPRREWVGLTRAERFEIEKAMSQYYDYRHECKTVCLPEFAAAIEAKLKEKNT